MRRVVALLLGLVPVFSSSIGHTDGEDASQGVVAESHVDRWTGRPLAAYVVVGLGTPVGWLGGSVEYGPVRWFVVGGGLGAGWYGPQLEGHARFEIPLFQALSLGVGGGASVGKFTEESHFCIDCTGWHTTYEWSPAVWANGEVSLDGRTEEGFAWRVFFGAGKTLNHPDKIHAEYPNPNRSVMTYYLGAAFGHAFDL